MGHTVWIEQCGDYAHSDGWRQRWQSYGSRLELREDANGWCLVCTGTEEESGAGTEELFHDPRYYNTWNAVHGACGLRLRIYSEHEAAHAMLHIRYSEDRWQTSENRWRHAMPLRAGLNDIVLPFDDGQWTAEGRESYIEPGPDTVDLLSALAIRRTGRDNTWKLYAVGFETKPCSDGGVPPFLSGLILKGARLDREFSGGQPRYIAWADEGTEAVELWPEVPPRGILRINMRRAESGRPFRQPLRQGLNILRLRVADRDTGRRSETEIHLYRYFRAWEAYRIRRRPQFHYTPQAQWMNDPNGLIYNAVTGEYHLYYQFKPESNRYGEEQWAHAISRDLMHWTETGTVLFKNACSGSGVVDLQNDSGLFNETVKPEERLVFFYNGLNVACSPDGGYSMKGVRGTGTPGTFDPKVTRYTDENGENAVWLAIAGLEHYKLWTSTDLRHWTYNSTTEGKDGVPFGFECPDIYPLCVDGDPQRRKWVINEAGIRYVFGELSPDEDGRLRFRAESEHLIYNGESKGAGGGGFLYASQSFFNDREHRRITVSWLGDHEGIDGVEGRCWIGAQTVPMETTLATVHGAPLLKSYPIREVESLRDGELLRESVGRLPAGTERTVWSGAEQLTDTELCLYPDAAAVFRYCLRQPDGRELRILYDCERQELAVDTTACGRYFGGRPHMRLRPEEDGSIRLRILLDVGIVEVFGNRGEAAISTLFDADTPFTEAAVSAEGGAVVLQEAVTYRLRSVWESACEERAGKTEK